MTKLLGFIALNPLSDLVIGFAYRKIFTSICRKINIFLNFCTSLCLTFLNRHGNDFYIFFFVCCTKPILLIALTIAACEKLISVNICMKR